MPQERFEKIQRFGIPLCRPEDGLEVYDNGLSFAAPSRSIPDVGEVLLSGSRVGTAFPPGQTEAMALMGSELVTGPSVYFHREGLYELRVRLERTGRPLSLVCQLSLPSYFMSLESPFDFGVDDMQPDPMKKYNGATALWSRGAQTASYVLFAPKDTQVLSQPLFRFHS
ncbi:MAG TPA: hypothetical protein VND99_01450 [Candidatus Acidoferrales bacterium]|nr:hypothetical protein [Candidatus Acidoferrales bacterium]